MTTISRSVIAVVLLVSCSPSAADEQSDCLVTVFSGYADAQRAWQGALEDLIESTRPELADLGQLSTALQLALIDLGQARFLDHLERNPDRLKFDTGLTDFVNVGVAWTDEDETELQERDADYGALQARLDDLRARNDGHADWPALRALFQAELAASASYMAAAEELQSTTADLEKQLAQCGSSG